MTMITPKASQVQQLVTRLTNVVHGPQLSADKSSQLQQLGQSVDVLVSELKSLERHLLRKGDINVLLDTSVDKLINYNAQCKAYDQKAKELRLGGSCTHGADRGPNCTKCLSTAGRLTGPFAGFPDGLEAGDYLFHQLRAVSRKKSRLFVGELDRISQQLQDAEDQLKHATKLVKTVGGRVERLKRVRSNSMLDNHDDADRPDPKRPASMNVTQLKQSLGVFPDAGGRDVRPLVGVQTVADDEDGHTECSTELEFDAQRGSSSEMDEDVIVLDDPVEDESQEASARRGDDAISVKHCLVTIRMDHVVFELFCVSSTKDFHQRRKEKFAPATLKQGPLVQVNSLRELRLAGEVQFSRLTKRAATVEGYLLGNLRVEDGANLYETFAGMERVRLEACIENDRGVQVPDTYDFVDAYRLACTHFSKHVDNAWENLKSIPVHGAVEYAFREAMGQKEAGLPVRVNLSNAGMSEPDLVAVCACLRHCGVVKELDLSENISLTRFTGLGACLSTLIGLVKLDLSTTCELPGREIDSRGLVQVFVGLRRAVGAQLEAVDLRPVGGQLETLNLSGRSLCDTSRHSQAPNDPCDHDCSQRCTDVVECLNSFGCLLGEAKQLRTLNLARAIVWPREFERTNHSDGLLCRPFSDALWTAMSSFLRGLRLACEHLDVLDVSGCVLSSQRLAESFCRAALGLGVDSYAVTDLNCAGVSTSMPRTWKSPLVGGDGASLMFGSGVVFRNVQESGGGGVPFGGNCVAVFRVNLSGMDLSGGGLGGLLDHAMAVNGFATLERLDLSGCSLSQGDWGALSKFAVAQKMGNLRELYVQGNQAHWLGEAPVRFGSVSWQGGEASVPFGNVLRSLPKLQVLDLSGMPIEEAKVLELLEEVVRHGQVRGLSVGPVRSEEPKSLGVKIGKLCFGGGSAIKDLMVDFGGAQEQGFMGNGEFELADWREFGGRVHFRARGVC